MRQRPRLSHHTECLGIQHRKRSRPQHSSIGRARPQPLCASGWHLLSPDSSPAQGPVYLSCICHLFSSSAGFQGVIRKVTPLLHEWEVAGRPVQRGFALPVSISGIEVMLAQGAFLQAAPALSPAWVLACAGPHVCLTLSRTLHFCPIPPISLFLPQSPSYR